MHRRPYIAVTNESSVMSDEDLRVILQAVQHQVEYHVRTWWNVSCVFEQYETNAPIPTDRWRLAILDDSDQAGALGYHDMTNEGMPFGKVFAKTDRDYNLLSSVTLSHEVIEMIVDPYISAAWQTSNTEFTALELGDPVEADSDGYPIHTSLDSVPVSNFILPAWFGEAPNYVGNYDYAGLCKKPLEIRPGGYMSVFHSGHGWTQMRMVNGELVEVKPADVNEVRFRDRTKYPLI